jgi:hypothetical protein
MALSAQQFFDASEHVSVTSNEELTYPVDFERGVRSSQIAFDTGDRSTLPLPYFEGFRINAIPAGWNTGGNGIVWIRPLVTSQGGTVFHDGGIAFDPNGLNNMASAMTPTIGPIHATTVIEFEYRSIDWAAGAWSGILGSFTLEVRAGGVSLHTFTNANTLDTHPWKMHRIEVGQQHPSLIGQDVRLEFIARQGGSPTTNVEFVIDNIHVYGNAAYVGDRASTNF